MFKSLKRRGAPGELLPPKWLQWFVGGGYKETGPLYLKHLTELCALQPDDAILDVGCGSGRIAVSLIDYLGPEGRYEGFDVGKKAVEWCQENITTTHPNFRFQVADVYNGFYHRTGKTAPADFRFPYPDESFDVVFLASVFTHIFPDGVQNYLREVARVLKPGGRCLISFFLYNDEARSLLEAKAGKYNFKWQRDGFRTLNPIWPEIGVAYEESWVRNLYEATGLEVRETRYGSWCGRDTADFQDLIVAVKPSEK